MVIQKEIRKWRKDGGSAKTKLWLTDFMYSGMSRLPSLVYLITAAHPFTLARLLLWTGCVIQLLSPPGRHFRPSSTPPFETTRQQPRSFESCAQSAHTSDRTSTKVWPYILDFTTCLWRRVLSRACCPSLNTPERMKRRRNQKDHE